MNVPSVMTVAAAEAEYHVPRRTLYRGIEQGILPATKNGDGVTLVERADVITFAAQRTGRSRRPALPEKAPAAASGAVPAPVCAVPPTNAAAGAHANGTTLGATAPTRIEVGGDLAAAAVAAFDSGATVKQFCQQQRIAPDLALAAWRKIQELEDAGAGSNREDRVHALEKELVQVRSDLELIVQGQDSLAASLAALASRLADIHVPPSVACVCKACGASWVFGRPAHCPNCGEQAVVGVPPLE